MKIENSVHVPVLVKEVIEYLNVRPGAKIIDATVNGGGHTRAILEKYPDVSVLGIEWDPEIFKNLKIEDSRFRKVNDSYVNLKNIVEQNDFSPDGILFDLGLSSWHYESGKGFSFRKDEFLDMRFNPETQGMTAADVVNKYSPEDLEEVLKIYGEESFAGPIVKNIIRARKEKAIATTEELVRVIGEAVPEWYKHKKIHFATKTFQALRVAVNDELANVEKGISEAIKILKPGGRLVVISFQGMEDKIVKNIFREKVREKIVQFVVKGTIKPTWEETRSNPRARSAKMKAVEKI